jgi:hypothetical protein
MSSVKLPEYLQRTAYGTKPDPDGFSTPFQYGLNTKLGFFDWLKTKPENLTNFNLAMVSFHDKPEAIDAYPFTAELSLDSPSAEGDEVLLVDVGGGRGHVVEAIRKRLPEMKGRMVVQDLQETIDEIQDPKGFEPMAHDFFTPQPIKGFQPTASPTKKLHFTNHSPFYQVPASTTSVESYTTGRMPTVRKYLPTPPPPCSRAAPRSSSPTSCSQTWTPQR